MSIRILGGVIIFAFLLTGLVAGQQTEMESPRKLQIPRVSKPPKLQDFLGETPQQAGARVTDFRQREPGDGTPASQQTTAYVSYDDKNLYVVFVCKDEPGKTRARMSKREDTSDDDTVAVYLDTYYDHRHAYYFSVNPLGIQADGVITEGQSSDARFDTLWYSDGRVTPQGYVAWMAIPFKSLRFANEPSQTWGIALRRSIVRNNENSYWPYITRRTNNFVPQLAALEGIEQISSPHNIQLIPYGSFTNAKLLNQSVPRYMVQNEARAGLDSKIVLHDSLSLDITVNPDFSQVESDDPQVTVNQRYEVQFPEKRPFFIENSGYFETPLNLFFSRRIVDPEFGARLTGKLGHWAIGLLAIDDRAPGKLAGTGSSLYGDHAVASVFRVQREFGKDSRIGVLATTRNFGSSYNNIFSIDTRLKLSPTWYFTGQIARSADASYDPKLKLSRSSGMAVDAELLHADRHFTYTANYQDFSPNFRAPLGFIKRVDIRKTSQFAGYIFRPENSKVLDFGPSFTAGVDWDHQGLLQDWYTNAAFAMDFKGPIGFQVVRYDAFERYLGQGFRYSTNSGSFYASWMKWLIFYGSFSQGTGINYAPAYGVNPFLGTSQNASFGFTLRPNKRMRLEESYYFTRLGTRRGFLGSDAHPTVFNDNLSRTKLNYQFTRALSLRGILDYYALLPNTALFNSERYKQLAGDVLLTYLLNPGTALYVGYTNRRENLAIDPDAPPMLRRYGPPSYVTGTQLFVKLSYLFRF